MAGITFSERVMIGSCRGKRKTQVVMNERGAGFSELDRKAGSYATCYKCAQDRPRIVIATCDSHRHDVDDLW